MKEMKCYAFRFTGRKVGAIGKFCEIEIQLFAQDEAVARLKLYDHFEHISNLECKEWSSPFSDDHLVNYVQNTPGHHARIRKLAAQIRDELNDVANHLARANKEWHDDPEAEDHLLFHAPAIEQYPQRERDAAALELLKRHLEVIAEKDA